MGLDVLLDEIKSRLDIVDVISQYVPLKKRGKNFVALCPFHVERTPSFTVSPDKQFFYCFGCGKGGDVIKFLMLIEDLSFREAVAKAADMAGIEVNLSELKEKEDTNKLREIHKLLTQWFSRFLKTDLGKEAREYLLSRDITPPWWERFKIGFSPKGFDLATPLMKKGFTREELIESGVFTDKNGELYCKFVNRVMIPICDASGRVVAFGGRVVGDGEPKYLNSPETPIFVKSRIVFGYHLAREFAKKRDRVIVVEGYMDVISLHIKGFEETVAALGTAFSEEQARRILRLTKNVFLVFDGDEAGFKAALRASKAFYKLGVEPRVVLLPEGEDPDSFVRKGGDLNELLEKSLSPVDLILRRAEEKGLTESALGKSRVISEILELVEGVTDPVVLESFLDFVSSRTGISVNALKKKLELKPAPAGKSEKKPVKEPKTWEREFLRAILQRKDLFEKVKDRLEPGIFEDELVSSIVGKLKEAGGLEKCLDKLADEEMKVVGNLLFSEKQLNVDFVLKQFNKKLLEEDTEKLKRALLNATSRDEAERLYKELLERIKILKEGRGDEYFRNF